MLWSDLCPPNLLCLGPCDRMRLWEVIKFRWGHDMNGALLCRDQCSSQRGSTSPCGNTKLRHLQAENSLSLLTRWKSRFPVSRTVRKCSLCCQSHLTHSIFGVTATAGYSNILSLIIGRQSGFRLSVLWKCMLGIFFTQSLALVLWTPTAVSCWPSCQSWQLTRLSPQSGSLSR